MDIPVREIEIRNLYCNFHDYVVICSFSITELDQVSNNSIAMSNIN